MGSRQAVADPPNRSAKQKKPKPVIKPEELRLRDLFTPLEAAWLLNISESKLYELIMDIDPITRKPALRSVKIGRRRLIPRRAIEAFIEGL